MTSFAVLQAMIDQSIDSTRNWAIGLYLSAGAVLAIVIALSGWRDFYKQGPIVLVVLLLIPAVFFHQWYRTLRWDRHPVLLALLEAPERIASARVLQEYGLHALREDRSVVIATAKHSIGLTLQRAQLPGLATALRGHCPNIVLEGF